VAERSSLTYQSSRECRLSFSSIEKLLQESAEITAIFGKGVQLRKWTGKKVKM
jgi:hypothetical protein